MRYPNEHVEAYRQSAGELENHIIDEFKAGRLSRRQLMMRGTIAGMSIPMLGLLADGAMAAPTRVAAGKAGGALRIAVSKGATSFEPPDLAEQAEIITAHIPGEQLCFADSKSKLIPILAESWAPSNGGKTWTFKLRQGVKFHDGTPMTADDVVASFERLVASAFVGVFSAGSTKAVDPNTVQFNLDAANGFFPYQTAQTVYQAVILKKDYVKGDWIAKNMNGTGPYKLQSYTPDVSAKFVRNPDWWGTKAGFTNGLDSVELQYLDGNAKVLALKGGQVDMVDQVSYLDSKSVGSAFKVIGLHTATHRQMHMNTTSPLFKDKRVRQAIALTLNRPGNLKTLWGDKGEIGNDHPFWSGYVFSNNALPQKKQSIAKAKALLKQAGKSNLSVTLSFYQNLEMPQYAALAQQQMKQAGIKVKLKSYTSKQYFAGNIQDARKKGATPWLSVDMGIVDWGHRAVPVIYLTRGLSHYAGDWNPSRFNNKTFDNLVKAFIASADLQSQKANATKIEKLLIDETPSIFSYFYDFIAVTTPKVQNYTPDGLGVVNLRSVTLA
jgi:peptide/nickel transport system substrate-binding protein